MTKFGQKPTGVAPLVGVAILLFEKLSASAVVTSTKRFVSPISRDTINGRQPAVFVAEVVARRQLRTRDVRVSLALTALSAELGNPIYSLRRRSHIPILMLSEERYRGLRASVAGGTTAASIT